LRLRHAVCPPPTGPLIHACAPRRPRARHALPLSDFAYNQTTRYAVKYASPSGRRRSVTLKGAVHSGFASIHREVAPSILRAVLSEAAQSKADTVIVTGHSLGAGVGQLVALALQVRRRQQALAGFGVIQADRGWLEATGGNEG
jgi:hypothetical protein